MTAHCLPLYREQYLIKSQGWLCEYHWPTECREVYLDECPSWRKLSIVTRKAQTTRHRILGMYNDDDHQIIFSDTPGWILEPAYALQQDMNNAVLQTFEDGDLTLYAY